MVSFIQFGSRPPLYHARLMNVFPSPKVKGLAGTLTRKEVAVARPSSKAENPINRNHEDCTHGRVIDEVRNDDGKTTGQVRCFECGTVFDDPDREAR